MGVYAGDTVPYLTETFNVAPDVQRYIGNALVRDNDDVKPTLDLDFANNKSLIDDVSGDNLITFTRTTVGTYVDSDGLIKTSNFNAAKNSQTFDNNVPFTLWSPIGLVSLPAITTQTKDPFGGDNASKIIPASTGAANRIYQNIGLSGTFTCSVYAKAAEYNFANIGIFNGTAYETATVDLTTGNVSSTLNSPDDFGSQYIGNGWWRIFVVGTTTNLYITIGGVQLGTENLTTTGNDVSGIFIFGAQANSGTVLEPYLESKISTNYFPRYDHDPVTLESLGLLIEESRINVCTFSEDFTGTDWAWQGTSGTITSGFSSPAGNLTASKLITSSNTSGRRKDLAPKGVSGVTNSAVLFNLLNGEYISTIVGSPTYGSEPISNGWYRYWLTASGYTYSIYAKSAEYTQIQLQAFNQFFYVYAPEAVGGNTTDGILIWGAQVEAGSFPTSYIPTTTSTVTRGPDIATITGSNFDNIYNTDASTIFFRGNITAGPTGAYAFASIQKEGADRKNSIILSRRSNSGSRFNHYENTPDIASNIDIDITGPVWIDNSYRNLAAAIGPVSAAFADSGSLIATVTSYQIPSSADGLDVLRLGAGVSGGISEYNCHISRFTYYPTRLPNATLQELTQDNPTNLPATITPPIVTDGLVLNLDAGTPSSYSGTGTTWFDKTDNNNDVTLVNGPTFSTDGTGSIVFPGTNEYGTLGNTFTNGIRDITVSAWIYLTDDTERSFFITKYGSGDNGWLLFYRNPANGNAFSFDGRTGTGVYSTVRSITQPSLNKWYHVVGIRQSDNWKIYVDGNLENSIITGSPTNVFNSTAQVEIGRIFAEYATAKIANIKVYDRALSPTEVKQNYQALLPRFAVTDGLVLNLDAGNRKSYPATGTTWTDLTGNGNDGTLTNGPTFDSSNGGSIVFDGTDEFVSVPDNSTWDLPGDFSLQVWFKRNAAFASTWWRDSFIGHDDGGGLNNKWIFTYDGTSLLFHTNTTSGSSQLIQAPIPWTPSNNEWYLVNLTKSGNVYTFYQNSISLGSVTNTAPIPDSSAPLTIGTAEGGSLFNGNIAQVKIYNKALSQEEVQQNFNVTRGRFGI